MADESRFAVYFSHSWRPRDVDLNVRVWQELAGDCEILGAEVVVQQVMAALEAALGRS